MYNIQSLTKKSTDWYIVDLTNAQGAREVNVSINRTGKNGEVFPNFDGIAVGSQVEGTFWKSGTGKSYLFPPKVGFTPPTGAYSGPRGAGKAAVVEKAMERKETSIGKFQDNKEHSIMVASTASQASAIVVALMAEGDVEDWKKEWTEIRYWLIQNWNNIEQPKVGSTEVDYPQAGIDDFDSSSIPF